MTIADPVAFIRENTRIQTVPHAPEISLWLADEVTPIWRMTEEALEQIGLPPPFWAFAWSGGQGLARWVLDHPQEVAWKRVLDFATGSGLVGIAAMKAGAASVLCADIDPFCAAAVSLNTALNGVEAAFTVDNLLDAPAPDAAAALARLRAAVQVFAAHTGPLQPHFAYGELSKAQYEQAHAMHLANHLSAFDGRG